MSDGTVILSSGGMDSFLVWALRNQTARNVFVNLDHKYIEIERQALRSLSENVPGFSFFEVKGPPIGRLELKDSGIIPLRNAELILAAAQFGSEILLGVTAGEINSDKSAEFFEAMIQVLNISWKPQYWNLQSYKTFYVGSPIISKTKAELIAEYIEKGFPIDWLRMTVSCYSANGPNCGECPSCFKRWIAMILNGESENYKHNPVVWAEKTGVIEKARTKIYSEKRAYETLHAIELAAKGL